MRKVADDNIDNGCIAHSVSADTFHALIYSIYAIDETP